MMAPVRVKRPSFSLILRPLVEGSRTKFNNICCLFSMGFEPRKLVSLHVIWLEPFWAEVTQSRWQIPNTKLFFTYTPFLLLFLDFVYYNLRKEPCFSADLSSACFFGEDLKRIGLREDLQKKYAYFFSNLTTKAIKTAAFPYTFKDKKLTCLLSFLSPLRQFPPPYG